MTSFRKTFAQIDLSALEFNYRALQQALGGSHCQLAPMVKANAYGHGEVEVSQVCEKLGAKFLCVSLIEEGIRLRENGIRANILVFGLFDQEGAEAIAKYKLTPVISRLDQFHALKKVLRDSKNFPVHVKFNTGMNRLGFDPEQLDEVTRALSSQDKLKLSGVCTHFSTCEDYGISGGETAKQIDRFSKISSALQRAFGNKILLHYMNSAAVLGGLKPSLDLARAGLALYGALPKLYRDPLVQVRPVMTVKSALATTHSLSKGGKVSYEGTWTASRDSTIGVVPIGYADGVPRLLSNRGSVLIRETLCPIVGVVCMDYIMVDLTELRGPHPNLVGEEVVLFGKQGDAFLSVEQVSQWAQTPYEVFTGILARVPRVYLNASAKELVKAA